MLAKFSKFFPFLVICFLTLFNQFAIQAQNNTNSCDWKNVMEYEWQWETRYSGITNTTEPQPVLKLVEKRKYVCGIAPITVPDSVPVPVSNSAGISAGSKYSAPSDSPMLGTWVYVDGCKNLGSGEYPVYSCDRRSSFVYSKNGSVQSIHLVNLLSSPTSQVTYENWKYTAEDETTGVLQWFKDDKLIEKGDVKFLEKSRLQYTVTFSNNKDSVGKTYIFTKQ